MDINNLQRTSLYSYQIDTDRIKQRLADKNSAADRRQGDSMDISEEGRSALREMMSAADRIGQAGDIANLPSMNSGSYGIMSDFEKVMSELGNGSVSDDSFDSYANKMAAAYQLMKGRIEEKYAASDRQKEYYAAADGSMQEMTKEKELEMLDSAYEAHSRFMATNTQIWSELRDFKVQIDYHSGSAKTEAVTEKKQNADIRGQAYIAFLSAINEENSELLKQETDSLNHLRLNLGIPSSARDLLNSIWDYHVNLKH